MNKLFFDTETTGLPPKGGNYSTHFKEFPYIVEIAWQLVNEKGDTLIKESHIIRPDGYEIPEETSEIHGITTERAIEEGHDIKSVLRHFMVDCDLADNIVAHNIYFDTSMIKANLLKLGVPQEVGKNSLHKDKRIDTMRKKEIIQYVEARYEDGRVGKWPRLEELHFKLFGESFEDQHNAAADVEALKRCYYGLQKLNIL